MPFMTSAWAVIPWGSLTKGRLKGGMDMAKTRLRHICLHVFFLSIVLMAAVLYPSCCLRHENPFLYGAGLGEFVQRGPTEVYNRGTLFDYMDGEAEVYLPLGFSLLYTAGYRKPGADTVILVEAYDMGTSTGAQGIFDVYTRKGGAKVEGIGTTAWTDKAVILFQRNRYFVRIGPDPTEQTDTAPPLNDLIRFSRSMDHVVSLIRQTWCEP